MEPWSEAAWGEEMQQLSVGTLIPPSCPQCHRQGFFGPRLAEGPRRYWLCKFCGHYREPATINEQCRAAAHSCAAWPEVLGSPYIWWTRPNETTFTCPYCDLPVEIETATVATPFSTDNHPWRQVPEGLTFDQAAAFWARQGQGRVYL